MSVSVRPAQTDDIEGVCDLLHANMSSKISKERWRGLLDYPWRPADAGRGMVALDAGRVVGFLGLVYVDRRVAGRTERFCNICAWYLLKDYRGRGIGQAIQRAAITDRSQTYTLVTATAATSASFRKGGFQILDDERHLLRRIPGAADELELIEGPDAVETRLQPGERRLLDDHRAFNLRHLVFRDGGDECYLVLQVKKKGKDISYHEVMHASDLGFLAEHAQRIANALLMDDRSVFAIDRRFVDRPLKADIETIRQPRLYSSPRVPPNRIDHLYSEIVLLDLKLP